MERKLVPTLLGAFGGLLILLGALVAFLLGMVNGIATSHPGPLLTGMATGAIAGAVGFIALVLTYYSRGSEWERLAGGIGLLVLGVVSWAFLMSSALAIAGSILVFFGGLVFTLEGLIPTVRGTTYPRPG